MLETARTGICFPNLSIRHVCNMESKPEFEVTLPLAPQLSGQRRHNRLILSRRPAENLSGKWALVANERPGVMLMLFEKS